MNICILGCKSYPPGEYAGGIEVNVWETTQRLKNTINFQILTMHGKGHNIHEIPYIPGRLTRTPSYNLFALKKLRKLHKKIGIDLIHAHEAWAGVIAGFFKRISKIPIILTMHTIDSLQPEWKWFRNPFALVEKLAIKSADKVIVPSEFIRNKLFQKRGLNLQKSLVIPNGVDLNKYQQKGEEKKNTLIFTGRLTKSKNLFTLMKVMKDLPDYLLRIVGTGPLKNKLKHIAPKNVEFLNFRRDIPNLLSKAEIYILPSISEGSPISLIEALAARKPIVASAVGGIPEIVGTAGILVPPTEENIIRGIKEAQNRKEILSKEAGKRAEKYNWDIILSQITKLYLAFQK